MALERIVLNDGKELEVKKFRAFGTPSDAKALAVGQEGGLYYRSNEQQPYILLDANYDLSPEKRQENLKKYKRDYQI